MLLSLETSKTASESQTQENPKNRSILEAILSRFPAISLQFQSCGEGREQKKSSPCQAA